LALLMSVIIVFRRVAVNNNASNDWTMLMGICLVNGNLFS